MGRSYQASKEGVEKAKKALKLKGWTHEYLAGAARCTRQTISKFFNYQPVEKRCFQAICNELDLEQGKIAELEPEEEQSSRKLDIATEGEKSPTATAETTQTESVNDLVQRIRAQCSEKFQHLYSKIRLLNRKQIEVDRLYVDVYILEQPTGANYASMSNLLKSYDPKRDRLALGKQNERKPGFDVANEYEKLTVLGKPGSGKTTFLRHLAIACCKEKFQPDCIPVLIELRLIADSNQFDLERLIRQELQLPEPDSDKTNEQENRDPIKEILNAGKVLLLLDALDEVADQARRKVQHHIEEFSKKYYKNRVVVTCRTQVPENRLDTFESVEIADFNAEQVEQFAHNWFTALAKTAQQGATLAEEFMLKLQQPKNKQTAELAVTPVLLSFTCWVFQDLQDFPRERTDLYRRGVELLLEHWDESRGIQREFSSPIYRDLSVEDKQILLGDIAIRKFKKDQFALFEQDEIQTYISKHLKISTKESREVLNSIEVQHGLLVERASQIYSFSHLTFQEYFAARWLCNSSDRLGVVSEQHWLEVLSMTLELFNANNSDNADRFAWTLKTEIDHLLSTDPEFQRFLAWLSNKAQSVKVSFKPAAVRAYYYSLIFTHVKIDYLGNLHAEQDLNLAYFIAGTHNLADNPEFKLDLALIQDLIYAYEIADISIPYLYYTRIDAQDAEISHDLDYVFEQNPDFDLKFTRKCNSAKRFILDTVPDVAHTSELKAKLRQMKEQLPSYANKHSFNMWWNTSGRVWIEKLRVVITEHRNIGQEWKFNERQKQQLQQYYKANQLLVNCLNSTYAVSNTVKQKIEETLLLPIAFKKHGE